MQEVHAMLHRLETLAIESANGTYNSIARANVEQEKNEILAEIDRICENTNFNGNPVFDSSMADLTIEPPQPSEKGDFQFQIGPSDEEIMEVPCYHLGVQALKLDQMKFGTSEGANEAINTLATAVQAVTRVRSEFGAAQNHLDCTYNNLSVTTENMTAAESRIRDTDMPDEITKFTSQSILMQSTMSMQSQANAIPQSVLSLLQDA